MLFAGAGMLTRQIADALGKENVPTMLVDTNPQKRRGRADERPQGALREHRQRVRPCRASTWAASAG